MPNKIGLPTRADAIEYLGDKRHLVVYDFEDQSVLPMMKGWYPAVWALCKDKHGEVQLWYYDKLHGGGFWSRFLTYSETHL